MKKKNYLLIFSAILLFTLLMLRFATRTKFISGSDQLYDIAIQYLLDHDNSPYKATEKDYQAFADYEGFGITEDNEYRYVYMWILDESFYVDENNKIRVGTGGSMPYKFYFKKDADEVVKYEIPKDGTEYAPSIKRMFPSSVARKMLKISSFDDSKIKAQLKEHYNYLEDTEIYYSDGSTR